MGLFGSKNSILDVINCGEERDDYLIWKWSPDGNPNNPRANSLRYGSSFRVREGQWAVLVYKQADGTGQEYVEGQKDKILDTQNFPVLAPILGLAYGGGSPFQAEVYFINASQSIKRTFFVDHIEVVDVVTGNPGALQAKCSYVFNIPDVRAFVRNHKLQNLLKDDLDEKVLDAMKSEVKNVMGSVLFDGRIPIAAVSARRDLIIQSIKQRLASALEEEFAIHLVRFDIMDIQRVKNGENDLDSILMEQRAMNLRAENDVYRGNLLEQQDIANENLRESLGVQRDVAREAGILGARQANLGAYQVGVQGEVGVAAAEGLGKLGSNPGSGMGSGMGGGGGMNPAAMMTSMMLGTTVGAGMSNMMGGMMNNLGVAQPPQPGAQPPAPPAGALAQYHVAVNGQTSGPYTKPQLQAFAAQGSITADSLVWKAGMSGWMQISAVPELADIFAATPPPPPVPGMPPVPPAL